jgi:hypothetical protein
VSEDRRLFDIIRANLSRKSSADLQRIAQSEDPGQWSPEAIMAASDILRDRTEGRALEPESPEEEPILPVSPPVPYSVGLITGFLPIFVLNGLRFGSEFAAGENPDLPVPFGPKLAWLALDSIDTEAVVTSLDTKGAQPASWSEGIAAAALSSIFVTPPLGDWTLAVGAVLFPPEQVDQFVKPLLERLSHQFREAQYYCTHRDVELHAWARAKEGRLVRGYAWLGQKGITLWNEGPPTAAERHLGFQFSKGGADEDIGNQNDFIPDEESVMQIASLWSIDPTTLNEDFKEPKTGLLANVAWSQDRDSKNVLA